MAAATAPARKDLNIAVETENNIKERKRYPVRERPFRPNLSVKPLTGKFYARHDCPDPSLISHDIEDAIKRKEVSTPRDRLTEPETTNQEYGWYLEPLVEIDRTDVRFYHGRTCSWITKIGAIIDKETKKVPTKPFTGVPFKF